MRLDRDRPILRRVAGIDVGSNTVRAIAACLLPDHTLVPFRQAGTMTALGRGLSTTGRMDPAAIAESAAFVAAFLEASAPLDEVYCVGTAAAREAANADELRRALRERAGVGLEIIAGEEEARLAYLGATATDFGKLGHGAVIADVGGKSTELATRHAGSPAGGAARGRASCGRGRPAVRNGPTSLRSGGPSDQPGAEAPTWPGAYPPPTRPGGYPSRGFRTATVCVGARSLTEAHLLSEPPSRSEILAARREAMTALAVEAVPLVRAADVLVAVGGTACSAAKLAGDRWKMGARRLGRIRREMCRLPLHERREQMAFDPARAEIICGGLIILEVLAENAPGRRIQISKGGIREGLLVARTGAKRILAGSPAGNSRPANSLPQQRKIQNLS